MIIHSFSTAYTGHLLPAGNNTSGSLIGKINSNVLLRNNVIKADQYSTNLPSSLEIALHRAMFSSTIFNITINADGTIGISPKDDGDIITNWASLELQLASTRPNHLNGDLIGYDIDFFASEYVQYQAWIEENFSGEKRIEELEKLDSIINSHVEKFADEYSQMFAGFLTENGVTIDQLAIKDSILDIFHQRVAQYQEFVQQNDDYANIRGTEYEVLLEERVFMGEQLRYAYVSQHPEMNLMSEHGYSIDDLVALGTLVKETWDVGYSIRRPRYSQHKSEEEFGVELGLAAMKYQLISERYDISTDFKVKLDEAFRNFIHYQNEQASADIISHRNDPYVRDKQSYAVDWDKQLVLNIIQRMINNLQSKDMRASFRKDMVTIIELYKNKVQDNQFGTLSRYHSYHRSSWDKSNYAGNWNRFVERLFRDGDYSRYLLDESISLLDVLG
jgi:hypothetical protein